MNRFLALWSVLLGCLLGGCTGFVTSSIYYINTAPPRFGFLARRIPLPHHVSQFRNGASLRFAMVHDVLCERYPKHGGSWYKSRNSTTNDSLAKLPVNDPDRWPLVDDLAVAYDRLELPQQAIPLLREKLAQQEAAGIVGRDLYTSYANLGTLLIHANMAKARSGDATALELVEEGLRFVQQSVQVNPNAHFGRERWQAAIVEFILATIHDPSLLSKFDCIGNRLDMDIEMILDREQNWVNFAYGRPNIPQFTQLGQPFNEVPEFFERGTDHSDPARWDNLRPIRAYITLVGAEDGWDAVDVPSHRSRVPFDEPALGIIGMWRQGGGANPHFALALGEIMLRTGQRYLAWNAFERASLLADQFSADISMQQFLRSHCARRQAAIEESLRFVAERGQDRRKATPWQHISLPITAKAIDKLRDSFSKELEDGFDFQKQYQTFETNQIAAGRAVDDERFYESFEDKIQVIATPVGPEETVLVVLRAEKDDYVARRVKAIAILGCGIGALLAAVVRLVVLLLKRHRAASI